MFKNGIQFFLVTLSFTRTINAVHQLKIHFNSLIDGEVLRQFIKNFVLMSYDTFIFISFLLFCLEWHEQNSVHKKKHFYHVSFLFARTPIKVYYKKQEIESNSFALLIIESLLTHILICHVINEFKKRIKSVVNIIKYK